MSLNLRPALPVAAAAWLLAAAGPASAGWNNVFQVCCHDCNRPRASFSVPVAPANPCPDPCPPEPCPQPEARVSYVQRCYYQPVTEMRRESFYVPVKENVTSYYYEPVTSCRYTTFYDPCTGCPQDIAVPVTSFRLRQQCNSVTRWVERSRCVPVTSYRRVTMYQPVVTYYFPPSMSRYLPSLPGGTAAPANPPRVDDGSVTNPPRVMPGDANSTIPAPKIQLPTTPADEMTRPKSVPPRPNTGSFARTASRGTGTLRGEVVLNDRETPRPGAKLVFVNAAKTDVREYATANSFGEFEVSLPAGEWHLYVGRGDGNADRHSKLTVDEDRPRDVTVVSR